MSMTDPIADMLTRIRNANLRYKPTVDVLGSKVNEAILRILVEEGYLRGYQRIQEGPKVTLRVELKYGEKKERVIRGLRRVSKPGRRVYAKASELPRVLSGLGTAIISTSQGMLSDREARKRGIGGEVICYVW
ncbi:MAG: 30S ribosomal protein S8 [Candidatus Poribacteria bacterium]|nr:MAG: 30S ribosomal protein S8 [Candidatus Poribacteria bacterium]